MDNTDITQKYYQTTKEAGAILHELMQTYQFCMQRTLSKYGLYPGQPLLLFAIRDAELATQSELAKKLAVSPASVGVSLRRLEKAGFVKRVPDKTDTRCNRITLTKKGADYAKWCQIDYDMIYTTMMEGFTGEERELAVNTLSQMQKSLDGLRQRIENR